MLPTVIGGGLATAHAEWHRRTRALCVVVALGPVVFVATDLIDSFGWSWRPVAGCVAMLVVYGMIIRVAQATFAPLPARQARPRWMTWAIVAGVLVLILIPIGIGGIV